MAVKPKILVKSFDSTIRLLWTTLFKCYDIVVVTVIFLMKNKNAWVKTSACMAISRRYFYFVDQAHNIQYDSIRSRMCFVSFHLECQIRKEYKKITFLEQTLINQILNH